MDQTGKETKLSTLDELEQVLTKAAYNGQLATTVRMNGTCTDPRQSHIYDRLRRENFYILTRDVPSDTACDMVVAWIRTERLHPLQEKAQERRYWLYEP